MMVTKMDTAPPMRKNHCHECRPRTSFMRVRIPAARKPEIMVEIVLPARQIAIPIGFSSFVYHEDVTGCW